MPSDALSWRLLDCGLGCAGDRLRYSPFLGSQPDIDDREDVANEGGE